MGNSVNRQFQATPKVYPIPTPCQHKSQISNIFPTCSKTSFNPRNPRSIWTLRVLCALGEQGGLLAMTAIEHRESQFPLILTTYYCPLPSNLRLLCLPLTNNHLSFAIYYSLPTSPSRMFPLMGVAAVFPKSIGRLPDSQ
jgi:hypothetical protein